MKLVIVATHPIQHFCPQYRSIASMPGVELTVVFGSLKGVETYRDPGFGTEVSWGRDLLDGFDSVVLQRGEKLATVLNRLSPDWVVVYGYASRIARTTWRWALLHPKQRLAYIADTEFRHRISVGFKDRLKSVFLSMLFRRVNAFLTVGDANEEYYRQHHAPSSKFVRMHFPIDPNLVFDPVAAAALRAELGITDSALVALNVGKFDVRKSQIDLIAAAALVPGIHLLLAGAGAQFEECKSAAAGMNNVTLLGFLHPKELATYYELADVYVHPSIFDHHPLAVSEAAAAGDALVVSDRTGSWGPTDDLIPGETGFVVRAKDVDALAEVLQRLEEDRELVKEMGERAQANSRRYQALAHGGFIEGLRRLDSGVQK